MSSDKRSAERTLHARPLTSHLTEKERAGLASLLAAAIARQLECNHTHTGGRNA